jgi:hypothetical protein
MELETADPKGLIREGYAIEGITLGECRSIFLDWALSLRDHTLVPSAAAALIAHYGALAPDHPMTGVLQEGLVPAPVPVRRGGRAGRQV